MSLVSGSISAECRVDNVTAGSGVTVEPGAQGSAITGLNASTVDTCGHVAFRGTSGHLYLAANQSSAADHVGHVTMSGDRNTNSNQIDHDGTFGEDAQLIISGEHNLSTGGYYEMDTNIYTACILVLGDNNKVVAPYTYNFLHKGEEPEDPVNPDDQLPIYNIRVLGLSNKLISCDTEVSAHTTSDYTGDGWIASQDCIQTTRHLSAGTSGLIQLGFGLIDEFQEADYLVDVVGHLVVAGAGDVEVDIFIDKGFGPVLAGSLTIPAGDVRAVADCYKNVQNGDLLTYEVTNTGASAEGLSLLARLP